MNALKFILIYFSLFAVLVFAFTQIDVFSSDRVQKFSDNQEERLAGYLKDVFVTQRSLIEDEVVLEAVDVMKSRLLATIDEPKFDYNIYVIRNSSVNAFALPGGNLVLHSGLFAFAESPEEVMAVLAHEIGHSEKDHIMQKMIKEIGFSVVFAALTGGDVGVFSEIGRKRVTTRFDREYEVEADAFALKTLEAASIDPKYLAVFFHRMSESSGDITERIDFISTHPSHNDRRQASLAYETAEDFQAVPVEGINWELVKGLLSR
ncbi:MAG: M48 family metallopeptidase [Balneolales bacterium]|nr:M48 family metallopeptidase [Balneolales bacterium]